MTNLSSNTPLIGAKVSRVFLSVLGYFHVRTEIAIGNACICLTIYPKIASVARENGAMQHSMPQPDDSRRTLPSNIFRMMNEPYGTYSPGSATLPLSMVTKLGLAHGGIVKKLCLKWISIHGNIVDAEVRGIRYRLNLSDNTTDTKILISSKTYDRPEIEAISAACKGKVFVDVGANIGYYTLSALHNGASRAVCIEPNPPSLARLEYNVEINGMAERTEIIASGVGPEGELTFYQTGGLGGSTFVNPGNDCPSVTLPTKPLLQILSNLGIESVGAMKVDIEGFEEQALTPFLDEAPESLLPTCVVMEYCHDDDWGSDLKAKFLSKGYRLAEKTRANYIFLRD